MKQPVMIAAIAVCALCTFAPAQTDTAAPAAAPSGDSPVVLKPRIAKYNYDAMPHDPLASAVFSFMVPGSGHLYNKEFVKGGLLLAAFYGGFFGAQYLLGVYDAYNTDTFYIEETNRVGDPTGYYHQVKAPKPDSEQKWPSVGTKAGFYVCIGVVGISWIYSIIDGYTSAKRYNMKLIGPVSLDQQPVRLAVNPGNTGAALSLHLKY